MFQFSVKRILYFCIVVGSIGVTCGQKEEEFVDISPYPTIFETTRFFGIFTTHTHI